MILLSTKNNFLLFLIFCILYVNYARAQQGKDGVKIISAANVIVNEYTSLTSDASSGNTSIIVNNSSLNSNNRFSAPLATGDLIMIIQMQGASINGTSNDSTWGTITAYNNCGLYELSEVTGVPDASTINLGCGLKNNYTASGKVQIIRIPRYTYLTINAGDTLTCDPWDGSVGGILATEVLNNTIVNGVVNAGGKGFRGGALTNDAWDIGVQAYYSTTAFDGGHKGEGIAGNQSDYDNLYSGSFCRGAAANGGGGANSNASGGGGANAGDINLYTGNGNPDTSNHSWITAWNFEYNGFANSTSTGGGKGGRTSCFYDANALVNPPGDPAWGADLDRSIGGKGGRPLDYSGGRIFMGGGGGAGGNNNGNGGGGGNGGGIILILSNGDISGSGYISSNGADGGIAVYIQGGDGTGGAGAGGAILLDAKAGVSNINITANGGTGGNQVSTEAEAEGGGGGGGGGYIAISNGTPVREAKGGHNGITHSLSFTEFPPNGGTSGGDGLSNEILTNIPVSSVIANAGTDASICIGSNFVLGATGGSSFSWSPSTGLSDTTISNPTASPTITTTYVVSASNGSCSAKDSVVITVLAAIVINTIPDTTICGGSTVTLNAGSSSYSYSWSPTSGLNDSTISNPVASPAVTTTYTYKVSNGSCSDSGSVVVTIGSSFHSGTLSAIKDTICSGTIAHLTTTGSLGTLQWQSGESINGPFINISGASGVNYASQPVSHTTYYRVLAGSGNCTDTSAAFKITTIESPVADYTSSTTGQTISFSSASTGAISYTWDFGDGKTSTEENPAHTYDSAGTYHVCLTVKNNTNCTFTSCKNVSVFADGVNDINAGTEWTLYPNPVSHELTITGNQPGSTLQNIEIYDVLGREVMNKNFSSGTFLVTIDVSDLITGVYYIKIRTNELNFIKQIIKE